MAAEPRRLLTHEEYFALEEATGQRHEYVAGHVYAMVGGTDRHSEIAANTIAALHHQLRRGPCKVYTSDMRIAIQRGDIFIYPDLSVACGEREFSANRTALINPTLVVEVLSPSTAVYDSTLKFRRYRKIPSLQVYLLIEQDVPLISVYSRNEHGQWLLADAEGMDALIALPSIGCALSLADVYAGVDFSEAAG